MHTRLTGLFLLAIITCFCSCKGIRPLAPLVHHEAPFVQLTSGKRIDSAEISRRTGGTLTEAGLRQYGDRQSIAYYNDGTYQWGRFKRNFYPQVLNTKLDVYQKTTIEVTTSVGAGGMSRGPGTSLTRCHYYFAKKGGTEVKAATFRNLSPVLARYPALKSKMRSYSIINTTTEVTRLASFAAIIAGLFILAPELEKSSGGYGGNNGKLVTGASMAIGGLILYPVSSGIFYKNERRVKDVLVQYDRTR